MMLMMLIRIQSLLIKPKVWRFGCSVSSIIGLLCYALSSSFNNLIGKWTWWKILLYIVFSFIICLAVLFPKAWERSTSSRFEAPMAFLVLMLTSVYSFFLDKVVNGKPDAYSLISSAAFAIMSLGLSRQNHCKFEADLLYFFCGLLVVQLMKIKLWLVIVGQGFSYFLITLRSTLDASGYLGLQVGDQVVIEISSRSEETTPEASQVDSSHADADNAHLMIIMPHEADSPLENEDLGFLHTQVDSLSQQGNSDRDLLMAQSMGYIQALKEENGNIIHAISKHVEEYLKANVINEDWISVHPDNNLVEDVLPSGTINNLQETVSLMVTAGFKEECCRAYSSWRKEFLEECIFMLGLQVEELNMKDDDNIIEKIERWIKALNVAVTILFPNEWILCDRVFEESISSAEIAFTEVCKELAISLLSFGNNLATCGWSYWPIPLSGIIHKVLNTLQRLMHEFELLFFGKSSLSLKNDARRVLKSLRIFMLLDDLNYGDKAQTTAPGGKLHPVTCRVMNYIIWEIKGGKLSLSAHVTDLLENNLEANSKNYNNPFLGYVFIMNNCRYIEVEAKLNGLETIIGKDWLQKNATKFRENLELYQCSWNKILDFLKLDIDELEPNVAAVLMKDKLHLFNEHFDEIFKVQSTWFVFDEHQREQLVKSIENILLPAYGNFIGRFQDFLGKHAYDYIKYGMLDVQDRVENLFLVMK